MTKPANRSRASAGRERRAARDQDDWVVLGMRETALFREDMAALRVIPPAHYIGAVEAMGEISELVGKLLAQD